MSVVAAAVVGSAVVGAYSANKASKAQAKSAKAGMAAEERMAEKNLEFQREMADQQREDFAPWRDVGQKALDSISLLAVDQIKKQGVRPDIMEDLVAISNLGEYFRMLKNFHAGAVQDLQAAEGPDEESELVEYDVTNRGGI